MLEEEQQAGEGALEEEPLYEGWVDLGVTLQVSDVERSLTFYRDGLGFEVFRDDEDPERRIVSLRLGNALLDLVMGEDGKGTKDQAFRLFWVVADLDKALDVVEASGGRIIRAMDYGIYCRDPDGYEVMLVQKEPDPEDTSF